MYCHYPPRGGFNGIDRVDNSKGYILGNCVPCCSWCNRAKADGTLAKFMDWIWWMRPELRPKWALQTEDTPPKRVIRWHDSFEGFPVLKDVQVSIKTARKLVDIITTSRKSGERKADPAAAVGFSRLGEIAASSGAVHGPMGV
jgi:hypothetical protein